MNLSFTDISLNVLNKAFDTADKSGQHNREINLEEVQTAKANLENQRDSLTLEQHEIWEALATLEQVFNISINSPTEHINFGDTLGYEGFTRTMEATFDRDGSGTVESTEWEEIVGGHLGIASEDEMDRNNKQPANDERLVFTEISLDTLNRTFDIADRSLSQHNGEINLEEVQAAKANLESRGGDSLNPEENKAWEALATLEQVFNISLYGPTRHINFGDTLSYEGFTHTMEATFDRDGSGTVESTEWKEILGKDLGIVPESTIGSSGTDRSTKTKID